MFYTWTEARCYSDPPDKLNALRLISDDNLTATYECRKGFTGNGSKLIRTIQCASKEPENIPWSWGNASFNCYASKYWSKVKIITVYFFVNRQVIHLLSKKLYPHILPKTRKKFGQNNEAAHF